MNFKLFRCEVCGFEYDEELEDELIAAAEEHAETQRYRPGGPLQVIFESDDELETGVFRVRPATARSTGPCRWEQGSTSGTSSRAHSRKAPGRAPRKPCTAASGSPASTHRARGVRRAMNDSPDQKEESALNGIS